MQVEYIIFITQKFQVNASAQLWKFEAERKSTILFYQPRASLRSTRAFATCVTPRRVTADMKEAMRLKLTGRLDMLLSASRYSSVVLCLPPLKKGNFSFLALIQFFRQLADLVFFSLQFLNSGQACYE